MLHGPRKWSEEIIEKLQLEGRGKGLGDQYIPWVQVQEVSSTGRSRRVHGVKIRREHHFLSDIEWNMFLLLEHSPDVVDIREQFPLDRDLTCEIAATLGIHHPCYPTTRVPIVMTTDFMVTRVRNGKRVLEAFDTKHEQEAEDPRSLEKLQIHRAYLAGVGIPHHLVFHSAIPRNKTQNLEWLRGAHLKLGETEGFAGLLEEACSKVLQELPTYSKRTTNLFEYCTHFDYRHGYETGTGIRAFRLLIGAHKVIADLNNPDLQSCPLSGFRVAETVSLLCVEGGI